MRKRITEMTFYPLLSAQLKRCGFNNIASIGVKEGYLDFECFYKSKKFIVEIKIGTGKYFKNLLRGITQAWRYCRNEKADGILVIEYPSQVRTPLLTTPDIVKSLATETKVNALFLSEFFNESFDFIKPSDIFLKLRDSIEDFLIKKEVKTSFKLIVEALRTGIIVISEILRMQKTKKDISELIDMVVGRFDLFLGLGQIEKTEKDKEELKLTAIDLIPYLLSNQILFYRIFSESTGRLKKIDADRINSIQDLSGYFKKITDIDYKAIYSIELISKLPDQKEIIEEIKEMISAINILKPEIVEYDLLGRLYHELLPTTTRKVLAAFYTNPVAADILTELTINKWDETIMDPSCGSGTLLVAAYRKKLNLYKKIKKLKILSDSEAAKIHKKFVEEHICGMDIMPFAAHLTAVNLAAQTPNAITNKVRVACQDSLNLQDDQFVSQLEAGENIAVEPFQSPIQITLDNKEKALGYSGVIGPEGSEGEKFSLKRLDTILMNPPFSDREKMPKWYRDHLRVFKNLIQKCGNRVNFWGFFMALADYLLKKDGKMGLVIPINIARGKATEKIRNYILKNYHIQYILKTTKELAFSEGAAFRDILFIIKKRKPQLRDLTMIIFLKESIKKMNAEDVKKIIEEIKEIKPKKDYIYVGENFEAYFIDHQKNLKFKENLMPIIGGLNIQNRKMLLSFFTGLEEKAKNKLRLLKEEEILEGFHASPRGLSELVFIVNPIDKSRSKRNVLLTLKEKSRDYIEAEIKALNETVEIPINIVAPSLKTITSIRKFDVTNDSDYLVFDNYKGFDKLRRISQWEKIGFNWIEVQKRMKNRQTFFAIAHRLNICSKNTSHVAIFHKEKMYTTHAFNIFPHMDEAEAKISTLFFNSVIGLIQIFLYMKETTGQYVEFMKSDLSLMKIIDVSKLSAKEKRMLLDLFEDLKGIKFPSIFEQLENRFASRVKLDKIILKVLGFSEKESTDWLFKIYKSLTEELKNMKEVKY